MSNCTKINLIEEHDGQEKSKRNYVIESDDEIIDLNESPKKSSNKESLIVFQEKYQTQYNNISQNETSEDMQSLENKSLRELDYILRKLQDEILYNNPKFSVISNFFVRTTMMKPNREIDSRRSIIVSFGRTIPPSELILEKIFCNGN